MKYTLKHCFGLITGVLLWSSSVRGGTPETFIDLREGYQRSPLSLFSELKNEQESEGEKGAFQSLFLGYLYQEFGNLDSAFIYYFNAENKFKQANNEHGLAYLDLYVGRVFFSRFYQADSLLALGHKTHLNGIKFEDPFLQASGLNMTASVYTKEGAYEKAYEAHLQMKEVIDNSDLNFLYVTLYVNMANAIGRQRFEGWQDSVLSMRMKVFEVIDTNSNRKSYMNLLDNLATDYYYMEKDSLSIVYYRKAKRVAEELGLIEDEVEFYLNVSNPMLYYYGIDSAIHYSKKALKLSREAMLSFIEVQSLEDLYKYYERAANKDSAYHYLVMYQDFLEDYRQDLLNSNLAAQELVFENQKVELKAQIKILEAENIAQSSREDAKRKGRQLRLVLSISLLLAFVFIFVIWFLRYRAKKNKEIDEAKLNQLQNENQLQRYRTAKDLHDSLGSMLSTVKLHFEALQAKLDYLKTGDLSDYEQSKSMLDKAVVELRRISHDMLSGTLVKFGLVSALEELRNSLPPSTGTPEMDLNLDDYDGSLSGVEEIALYRILQELIQNSLKHANCKHITIQLASHPDEFILVYEDDGIGFDLKKLDEAQGIGWKNIRDRAKEAGFEIEIDSMPGSGATVILRKER